MYRKRFSVEQSRSDDTLLTGGFNLRLRHGKMSSLRDLRLPANAGKRLPVFLLLLLFASQTIFAQDKVHLKEDYNFKRKGTVIYSGAANEGFRLRAISKKILTVELPDASLAEIKPKFVMEAMDKLTIMQDCDVFSEEKKSYKELDEKNKKFIFETIAAGTEVLHKKPIITVGRYNEYRVLTPSGKKGYVDAERVLNNLRYMVRMSLHDIYLFDVKNPHTANIQEQDKYRDGNIPGTAFYVDSGAKMIVIDLVKPYVKLRTPDGREGWALTDDLRVYDDDEYIASPFYNSWLSKVLGKICTWSANGGFLRTILVFLLYVVLLSVYAIVPVRLCYYSIYVKWLPNFICKLILWTFPLLFFFVSGMDIIKYPPFRHSVPLKTLCVLYVAYLVYLNITMCIGGINIFRCAKCKTVADHNLIDEKSESWTETKTTKYSDGRKNVEENEITEIQSLYQCINCGYQWWTSSSSKKFIRKY